MSACVSQLRRGRIPMMKAGRLLKFPGILLLLAAAAHAQNVCSFELADQSDGATSGFIFSLLASADSERQLPAQLGHAATRRRRRQSPAQSGYPLLFPDRRRLHRNRYRLHDGCAANIPQWPVAGLGAAQLPTHRRERSSDRMAETPAQGRPHTSSRKFRSSSPTARPPFRSRRTVRIQSRSR